MKTFGKNAILYSFNKVLRGIIGDNAYRNITSRLITLVKLRKYYTRDLGTSKNNVRPYVVYMADGRVNHGGLADRIYGIVSLFIFCKKEHADFRVNFTNPFNLIEYIVPNEYDWRIDEDSISYNKTQARPVFLKPVRKELCHEYMKSKMKKVMGKEQLHVYTNCYCFDSDFSSAFFELFRPSDHLLSEINENLSRIGGPFLSVTFRFQQLLGDFEEGGFAVLPDDKKKILIKHCIDFVATVVNENPLIHKALVTSDSKTFLSEISGELDYVYVIPGDVYHVGYTHKNEEQAYIKSFLDLFLISKAEIVYNFSEGDMYANSGFARLASVIGNKQYINVRND